MRFGFNLRGDLAKLDPWQLEQQLEVHLAEREFVFDKISDLFSVGNKSLYQSGGGMPLGRGLFHARIFYKINGFLYGGSHKKGLGRLYVIDCELKDIIDEYRRRIKAQSARGIRR